MDTKDLRWTKLTNHEREGVLAEMRLSAMTADDRVPLEAAIDALRAIVETP